MTNASAGRRNDGGSATDRPSTALIGRERERQAIDRLVGRTHAEGSALVIVGGPGVGKSALLDHAADSARATGGIGIHRVRSVASEATLPFAALGDVLHPLSSHFEGLPHVQRSSLEASLSLDSGPPGAPASLYAVCLAGWNVLAGASARHPLLVLVDDLQWTDPSSRRVLLFIARRLSSTRVAMVMATSEDPASTSELGDLARIELAGRHDVESAATHLAVLAPRFTGAEENANDGMTLPCIAGMRTTSDELPVARVALIRGRPAEPGDRFNRASELIASLDPLVDARELSLVGHRLATAEHPQAGRNLLTRIIDAGRRAASPVALPGALAARAEVDTWGGRMSSAHADASEAVALAQELEQRSALGYALVTLGRLDAIRGDLGACAESLARADDEIDQVELRSIACLAPAIAGFAALSRGDHESAVAHLTLAHDEVLRWGTADPILLPCSADLVEAHVRSGDRSAAGSVLEHVERNAEIGDLAWARAAVARCRGLLATSLGECREHFGAAAAAHSRRATPFEEARTRLCEGEMLRRFRRPLLARVPLRAALGAFRSLGARPWAERAEAELAAAGGPQARHERPALLEVLSPQELQVARAVTRGLSNPEIATSLFVSRKTVEAHLTRVYRKVGVRSRVDLIRMVLSSQAGTSIR